MLIIFFIQKIEAEIPEGIFEKNTKILNNSKEFLWVMV